MRVAMFAHREPDPGHEMDFERFVAEIQLYGTPKQISLTAEIVTAFVRKDGPVHFDTILEDLRDTLRSELRMEPARGPVWWLRFKMPGARDAQPAVQADGHASGQ
jgi:hypothetical protein